MTETVVFGLGLMTRIEPQEDPRIRVAEILEQARCAQAVGFESLWVSQHWVDEAGVAQPIPMLARLAGEVPGMALGSAVILGSLYPPGILAQDLVTLDLLTGGRLIVGLGAGYRDEEFRYVGVPRTGRLARFEETITTLRELWSGHPVEADGKYFQLGGEELHLLPIRPGGPAIWAGVNGPRATAIAGRLCEELYPGPMDSLSRIQSNQELFLEARAGSGFEDHQQLWPVARQCFVGTSREHAMSAAGPLLRHRYDMYVKWGYIKSEEVMDFDDVVDQMFILGSASECRDQIARLVDATGTRKVQLRMQWAGMPHQETVASIQRFGADVIPYFRGDESPAELTNKVLASEGAGRVGGIQASS